MREYEIVYIFRSNFTPEEIEAKLERYHGILTGGGRGEITAIEQWGKRQLAYPIRKQPNGYYVVAQFTAEPASLPELERVLKLEEDLLRYLIVLSEGELPIPGSMQSEMDDRVELSPTRTAPAPEGATAKRAEEPAAEVADDDDDDDEAAAADADDGADDEAVDDGVAGEESESGESDAGPADPADEEE